MRINIDNKLVFVSTPKCGSHTGWKLMETYFRPIRHSKTHEKRVPIECIEYTAFTFTRHPFDRAVSLWHSMLHGHPDPKEDKYRKIFLRRMKNTGDSFEDFCKHLISTRHLYNDFYSNFEKSIFEHNSMTNLKYLNYFKLEEINKTLPPFLKKETGIDIVVPYEHARKHRKWDEVKTPKSYEYLLQWAERDFENYKYDSKY